MMSWISEHWAQPPFFVMCCRMLSRCRSPSALEIFSMLFMSCVLVALMVIFILQDKVKIVRKVQCFAERGDACDRQCGRHFVFRDVRTRPNNVMTTNRTATAARAFLNEKASARNPITGGPNKKPE